MRFQRSVIFKPVDQMRRNKRQWEACKKIDSNKAIKTRIQRKLKINESIGQSIKIKIEKVLSQNFYRKGPHYSKRMHQ